MSGAADTGEEGSVVRLAAVLRAPASDGEVKGRRGPASRVLFGGPVKGFSWPSDTAYAVQIEERRELEDFFAGGPRTILCFRLSPQNLERDQ